jgi:hypothetical protein
LYQINLELWEYHDWQSERWTLLKDDNRAKIKKEINNLNHSEIIEEKQFISYNI